MLPGAIPGSTIGVSGGGGDPRLAFVVDVDAVEGKRFTPGSGASKCPEAVVSWFTIPGALAPPGGG